MHRRCSRRMRAKSTFLHASSKGCAWWYASSMSTQRRCRLSLGGSRVQRSQGGSPRTPDHRGAPRATSWMVGWVRGYSWCITRRWANVVPSIARLEIEGVEIDVGPNALLIQILVLGSWESAFTLRLGSRVGALPACRFHFFLS